MYGILEEKTNFLFEGVVHDDASIYRTPNIIRNYNNKMTNAIMFFFTENQTLKGKDIIRNFLLNNITGQYVILHDGDYYL